MIAALWTRETRTKNVLWASGGVLAIASLGFSGHAAAAHPAWMMTPSVLVHALTAAFWLGALWPLRLVVERCPMETAADLLRRFSRYAVSMVAVMIIAALVLSVVQVEQVSALATSDYGWILVAKAALVGLLLCVAVANKWRYVPSLSKGDAVARRRLLLTIRGEILLASLVVALAAGLGSVPPPRSLSAATPQSDVPYGVAAIAPEQRQTLVGAEGVDLTVTVTPAQSGANRIDLEFQNPDGTPLEPLEVTIELSHGGAGIEPLKERATRVREGHYRMAAAQMVVLGEWDLRIDALVDDFTKTVFRTVLSIEAPGASEDRRKDRQLFTGVGVVVSSDLAKGRIVIDHEEIKGYMAPMVMGFAVLPPSLLSGLNAGDKVRFAIDADKRAIVELKPLGR